MLLTAALIASAYAGAPIHRAAPVTYPLPAFTGYVVDEARLLPPAAQRAITGELDRLQHRTGHQAAVVTVTSLHGHSIEDYGLTLANHWGVGRRGVNDGVVILVAPRERRVRIEVGCGLTRQLPDAEANAIIQRRILPAFRAGNMAAGIEAGVDEVTRDLSPEGR